MKPSERIEELRLQDPSNPRNYDATTQDYVNYIIQFLDEQHEQHKNDIQIEYGR